VDAQPLLVVNCCDFVTGDGNIVSLCECFLHLVTDHVGKSMCDLLACQLRPVLVRLMWEIESIEQLLAGSVIMHGAAKHKQMKHGAKLNHFFSYALVSTQQPPCPGYSHQPLRNRSARS
jgi:hypothetical protein